MTAWLATHDAQKAIESSQRLKQTMPICLNVLQELRVLTSSMASPTPQVPVTVLEKERVWLKKLETYTGLEFDAVWYFDVCVDTGDTLTDADLQALLAKSKAAASQLPILYPELQQAMHDVSAELNRYSPSRADPPQAEPALGLASRSVVADFLAQPFDMDYGDTMAQIEAVLGAPQNRRVKKEHNMYQAKQIDDIITLTYPGLEFVVYRTNPEGEQPRELHLRTTVSSSHYAVKQGLGIGTRIELVRRLLGPPSHEDSRSIYYELDQFRGVAFKYSDGIVVEVERVNIPD
jgi:hypothetical protein